MPDDPILARRRQQRERARQRAVLAGLLCGTVVLAAVSFGLGRWSKGVGDSPADGVGQRPASTGPHADPRPASPTKGRDGLNQQMKDVFRLGQDMPAAPYGPDPAAGARNTPAAPPLFDDPPGGKGPGRD